MAMMYKNVFVNEHFRITFNTNSRYMHDFVGRFLDLSESSPSLKPKINIEFHVNFNNKKHTGKDKTARHMLDNKGGYLFSYTGDHLIEQVIDYKKNFVECAIFEFREKNKEQMLDFIFTQPLRFILAKRGLFSMHAAAVSKGEKAIIICGPQNSGKSTLALTLAHDGFDFLADDDCFIKLSKNKNLLVCLPTKTGFNSEVLAKYPGLKRHIIKDYHYGKKQRLSLHEVLAKKNTGPHACKMILFPKYSMRKKACLVSMPREKAIETLIKENQYYKNEYKDLHVENFWTIYNLVKGAEAFEVLYNINSLAEVPRLVQDRAV